MLISKNQKTSVVGYFFSVVITSQLFNEVQYPNMHVFDAYMQANHAAYTVRHKGQATDFKWLMKPK